MRYSDSAKHCPQVSPIFSENLVNSTELSDTDGTWYLHVQAKDEAGNIGNVTTVSSLLDNTPPVAALSPSLDQTPTSVTFLVTGPNIAVYRYQVDSQGYTDTFSVETPITLKALPFGPHRISVIARDQTGNWQPSDQATRHHWAVIEPGDVNTDGRVDLLESDPDPAGQLWSAAVRCGQFSSGSVW